MAFLLSEKRDAIIPPSISEEVANKPVKKAWSILIYLAFNPTIHLDCSSKIVQNKFVLKIVERLFLFISIEIFCFVC